MEDVRHFGSVIWFNNKNGFGFIAWSKDGKAQKDLFLHFSYINCTGFKTVKEGQAVSFTIGKNNKQQDIATDVTIL